MKRVESLDLLRALAALSVFFYHIHEVGNDPFNGLFNYGGIGVDLFFVLSGFFIGLSIIKPKSWDVKNFLKKRMMRIVPAYYASLVVILALMPVPYILTATGIYDVISHLTFIHPFLYGTHGSINGAYWSLGVEVQYYLAMAVFAVLFRSNKYRYFLLFFWIIISWFWRYYVSTLDIQPIFKFILSTQLIGMLDEFSLGIIVAIITSSGVKDRIIGNNVVMLFCALLSMFLLKEYLVIQGNPNYWVSPLIMVFSKSMLALSFALLILVFIKLSYYDKFLQILNYTGLPYVGRISYSFYLYHLPIIVAMKSAGVLNFNSIVGGLFCLLMTVLLSSISYFLVEKRFHKNC